MKEVERVGLLKMDFLGLSTLTLIRDALEEIKRTENVDVDIDAIPLDDREDLPALLRRPDLRCVPVRELGHARAPAQGQARAPRRPDRPQRALPARPAQERDGRRLHRAQAGQDRGEVRAPAARADPVEHLRRHRLSGAGHAHRADARRLHARTDRRAAQGHGEEGPQGHGEAARSVHGRRAREGSQREEGRQDLRVDGVLRRLRLSTSRTRRPTRSWRIRRPG